MTAEQLLALPEDDRIERRLIGGALVERPYPFRSPAHAAVIPNLCMLFGNWERELTPREWYVYGYGCPYRLRRDPDTFVCFDLSVVSGDLERGMDRHTPFFDGRPTLSVEVIDLNDTTEQVNELLEAALQCGVPMVWIIDPYSEVVDVYRPTGERRTLTPADEITADPVLPGFRCRVAEIFE